LIEGLTRRGRITIFAYSPGSTWIWSRDNPVILENYLFLILFAPFFTPLLRQKRLQRVTAKILETQSPQGFQPLSRTASCKILQLF
jgi:hypothetical protein